MIIVDNKRYYSEQELEEYAKAIATVEKYKYYKEYVENLESEFDELEDNYNNLTVHKGDYRKMASKLQEDKKALKKEIKSLNKELENLKRRKGVIVK